jgi:hypothetical protein
MISSGVALASQGELKFNMVGFIIQALAVAVSPFINVSVMAARSLLPFFSRSLKLHVWS